MSVAMWCAVWAQLAMIGSVVAAIHARHYARQAQRAELHARRWASIAATAAKRAAGYTTSAEKSTPEG